MLHNSTLGIISVELEGVEPSSR